MSLSDLTNDAVKKAIKEFDLIGRENFLEKYDFEKSKSYFLIQDGKYYDSKAIAAAAHGYLEGQNPLVLFSGGKTTVQKTLQKLEFEVTDPETKPFIGARPGDVLSNAEVSRRFKVGNMGGMRRNAKAHHLILISDPFKGLYEDRWEGEVLYYTGEGKVGDQPISKQNKTLFNSRSTDEVIHLFEVVEPTKYTYVGIVELFGEPEQETQPDDNGDPRLVWMFPLKISSGAYKPTPNIREITRVAEKRERKVRTFSDEELANRARSAPKKPSKRSVTTEQISRDPAVTEYVKRKANGICDLCQDPAPFIDENEKPYLECHHVKYLAKGGYDSISNAVALCPNCHRKMHSLNLNTDKQKLNLRITKRDEGNN